MNKNNSGFTLIELLLVISIIAILTSIVISATSGSKTNANYLKRVADLNQINLAITRYQTVVGKYPITGDVWAGYGTCLGGNGAINYIPELVPTYIAKLPVDALATATCTNGISYLYKSINGREYKLIANNAPDVAIAKAKNASMVDTTVRPNTAYGFWSPGGITY